MSPGFLSAKGDLTPGNNFTGLKLMYWSNSLLNFNNDPQSEIWSGTFSGHPTAPVSYTHLRAHET